MNTEHVFRYNIKIPSYIFIYNYELSLQDKPYYSQGIQLVNYLIDMLGNEKIDDKLLLLSLAALYSLLLFNQSDYFR